MDHTPSRPRIRSARERGQASVELLAALPAVLLVGALVWEIALAGQAAWLLAKAPRTGARARVVDRGARAAARSAVPVSLRRGMRVERRSGGAVHVRLNVPR